MKTKFRLDDNKRFDFNVKLKIKKNDHFDFGLEKDEVFQQNIAYIISSSKKINIALRKWIKN